MNIPIWCAWYAAGDVTVPRLIAQESACLVVLAVTLVVYRTFRERYLLIWILGWLSYLASNLTLSRADGGILARPSVAVCQAAFVLAVCLFAAAIFVYTHARKLLPPLLVIGAAIV